MNNDQSIPLYPEFAPISLAMKQDMYPALNLLKEGISEFSFSNLYLFRHVYGYQVSRIAEGGLIISGAKEGKRFFYLPCCFPDITVFDRLMETHDYMKNLSENQAESGCTAQDHPGGAGLRGLGGQRQFRLFVPKAGPGGAERQGIPQEAESC